MVVVVEDSSGEAIAAALTFISCPSPSVVAVVAAPAIANRSTGLLSEWKPVAFVQPVLALRLSVVVVVAAAVADCSISASLATMSNAFFSS